MSPKSNEKTLAMRLLEGKKIAYEVHRYDPDVFVSAVEVAEAISMPPAQVFKTIVVEPEQGKPILAVVPAPCEVDLKALASAARVKKARMATQADAERLTGLQKGGISALALVNRGFAVYLDQSAQQFARIGMSAGERGIQVVLAPADFVTVTNARVVAISTAVAA